MAGNLHATDTARSNRNIATRLSAATEIYHYIVVKLMHMVTTRTMVVALRFNFVEGFAVGILLTSSIASGICCGFTNRLETKVP